MIKKHASFTVESVDFYNNFSDLVSNYPESPLVNVWKLELARINKTTDAKLGMVLCNPSFHGILPPLLLTILSSLRSSSFLTVLPYCPSSLRMIGYYPYYPLLFFPHCPSWLSFRTRNDSRSSSFLTVLFFPHCPSWLSFRTRNDWLLSLLLSFLPHYPSFLAIDISASSNTDLPPHPTKPGILHSATTKFPSTVTHPFFVLTFFMSNPFTPP